IEDSEAREEDTGGRFVVGVRRILLCAREAIAEYPIPLADRISIGIDTRGVELDGQRKRTTGWGSRPGTHIRERLRAETAGTQPHLQGNHSTRRDRTLKRQGSARSAAL